MIHSTPITANAPAASIGNGSESEYQSSGSAPASATAKCTSAKARAARLTGGSNRRTRRMSKAGLTQTGAPAGAGCQPGGMNQTASRSRQRSARHVLRARSAYTSKLAHSGSQDSSGARVPYTQVSSSSMKVPNRRSQSMRMPP